MVVSEDIKKLASLVYGAIDLYKQNRESASEDDEGIEKWDRKRSDLIGEIGKRGKGKELKEIFGLDNNMVVLLLVVLLPSLRSEYYSIYKGLMESGRTPTIDTLLSLVAATEAEKAALYTELMTSNPLIEWHILELHKATTNPMDYRLTPHPDTVTFFTAQNPASYNQNHYARLLTLPKHKLIPHKALQESDSSLIILSGEDGVRSQAQILAQKLEQPLYEINCQKLIAAENLSEAWNDTLRFTMMNRGILYWADGFDLFHRNETLAKQLLSWLQIGKNRVIIRSSIKEQWFTGAAALSPEQITLLPHQREERKEIWQSLAQTYLSENSLTVDWERVALYATPPAEARQIVELLSRKKEPITTDMVLSEHKKLTAPHFDSGVTEVSSESTLDDLILSTSSKESITKAVTLCLNRQKLYETKQREGLGVKILLYGRSGTGKSRVAEAMANSLTMPLYKISYTALVDTEGALSEEKLEKLLQQAQQSDLILLFDEIEQLFANRSDQKSGNQHLTTTTLIQKIDDYSGLMIGCTNYKSRLDPAAFQLFDQKICFNLPTSQERLKLFKRGFEKRGVTIDKTIHLSKIAQKYPLSGARIEQIVQNTLLHSSTKPNQTIIKKSAFIQALKEEIR